MTRILLVLLFSFAPLALAESMPYPPEKIVDSIFKAEGGRKASVPYGIMFKGCSWSNVDYCRKIALNTVRNQWKRHQQHDHDLTYLECLANRYAPVGAKNDPKNLNIHWLKNVKYFLDKK